jgi:hypothetical protein
MATTATPVTPFTETTVVSEIDTNSAWFNEDFADPVRLPGNRAAADTEKGANEISRSQAGVVIRRLQKRDDTVSLPLGEAMDIIRGRTGANLRGRSFDFNVVNYCSYLDQQDNADEPLTVGQENMIDVQVRALLGTDAHFNDEVQAAIDKLTPEQRDRFVDMFESCTTRGELSEVLRKYERRVPNPARTQSSRTRAAETVANVNLDDEDVPFG